MLTGTLSSVSAQSRRASLGFSFDGVPERERTLFRSFVRLIDHRTRHAWTLAEGGSPDLLVVSDPARAADGAHGGAAGVAVLVLGGDACAGGALLRQLRLPIHAGELETVLDALGSAIASRHAHEDAAGHGMDADARVRLIRWPGPAMLASRDHLRLATLLTGRPVSAREMSLRSGVACDACLAFMGTLQQAGLLEQAPHSQPALSPMGEQSAAASAASAATSGLLTRIRQRLGIGVMARA